MNHRFGTQSQSGFSGASFAENFRSLFAPANLSLLSCVTVVALLCALLPCALYGQVVTASLQGTVEDPSGAGVAAAKVKALDTATGVATNTVTDSKGFFVFPTLPIGGPYTLTVQASGFKVEERSGIILAVNQQATISIGLQVGAVTQKVQVYGDVAQLETTNASLGQVIPNRSIVDLPLNQRNVYSLIFLVPGATGTVNANFNGFNLSVDGGRPGSSDVLIDGIPSSPPLVNPIQGFSTFPSVEAVQEFKMETSNYSAEFGRSGSGIVNIILKSGTNQFHGSAYEFLRNSALDANSYFSNLHGVPIPSFKRSQFGGSVGGPVWIPHIYKGKDKTFFFFSYEGLRQGTATQTTATVPTALQRTGDFSQTLNSAGKPVTIYDPTTTTPSGSGYVRQPFPGNVIPPADIDPVAAKIANYFPLPNTTGTVSGQNNFFASGTSILNINTYDTKVDEVINDRNRMFVRYSRRNYQQPATILFPGVSAVAENGNTQSQISNSAAIDYTFTPNPRYVMEFRYGFARMFLNFVAIGTGFNPSTQLGFPGYVAANADHLLFPGIAPANYVTIGNGGPGQSKVSAFESHLLGMNNTKVIGAHVLQFGGEGRLLLVNDNESGASTGNYNFNQAITQGPNPNVATPTAGNSIASLLLGVGSGTYEQNSKNVATASKYYGAYVQDNWRVNDRLTVNMGIRYDLDIPRTERYNRFETFSPDIPSPQLAQATGLTGLKGGLVFPGVDGRSRRQFQPQWLNFSPRLGLDYQLNDKTVVRGGYGIFYGPSMRAAAGTVGTEGFSEVTTYTGAPNGLTPSVYLKNPFPNGLNSISGSSQGLLTGIGSSFENSQTGDNSVGYTENWNLSVQRQLPFGILAEAAYVGSHGVHLNKSGENDWNANQLTTSALSLGTQLQQAVPNPFFGIIKTGPESGPTIARSFLEAPFPQFAAVYLSYLTGGYEDYNSIQVKASKRLSHGLSALVSYTGQKQIDNYSALSNVGQFGGGSLQNIYDPKAERSLSANNISQILVASAVYSLPLGRGRRFGADWNRAVDTAFGGWQINGIVTEQTGYPLSITTQNTANAGNHALRPNLTGVSPVEPGSISSRLNKYLNPAAFSQPAPFTFGNAPRTLSNVRAPGLHNIDFSIFKNFPVTSRVTAEFRAESYNLLNQVVFGAPNQVLTSSQFGVISSQANTPRELQFALKILF